MRTEVRTTSVETFFDEYAEALTSYSAYRISGFYKAPLTIYSDSGMQTVQEDAETLKFWKGAIRQYYAQEIERTEPAILSEEQLSDNIIVCKVHWRSFDRFAIEVASETNFYILAKDDEQLKIRGLIVMSQ